jgi:hypothetical protein
VNELGHGHDEPAITTIGDLSDDEREQHHRREPDPADESQGERAAGQRVQLPADRDGLHREGERGEDARRPERGEGRVAEEPAATAPAMRAARIVRASRRRAPA